MFPTTCVQSLESYLSALDFYFEEREFMTPDPPEPDQKKLSGWAMVCSWVK